MYTIKSIKEHEYMPNQYTLIVDNDAVTGDTIVLISGDSEVTLASGWPKKHKDFDINKHVFKKVKELKAGDQVITL